MTLARWSPWISTTPSFTAPAGAAQPLQLRGQRGQVGRRDAA